MSPAIRRSHHLYALALIALTLLIATAVTLAKDSAVPSEQRLASSVVKVIVQSNPPDLISPWQKLGIEEHIGSGVVIAGNRILTNAHVVENAVSIEVKRASTSARVLADIQYLEAAVGAARASL